MENFLLNILVGVVSGLLLALIFFLLKEFIFAKKNISGEWNVKLLIKKSTYNAYKDLEIQYKLHLLQKGYELSGSGEKIKEISSSGDVTEYQRQKRVTVIVEGFYEHKYLRKSKIFLNVIEDGKTRQSRKTHILESVNKEKLKGKFIWTAADSMGEVVLSRSS